MYYRLSAYFISCLMIASTALFSTERTYHISAHTQAICQRFYLIKRLESVYCAIHNAALLRDATCYAPLNLNMHPIINTTLYDISIKKNLDPLVTLWEDFTHYHYITDHTFDHDFVVMMIILYESLLDQQATSQEYISTHHHTIPALIRHIETKMTHKENTMLPNHDFHVDNIAYCFYTIQRLQEPLQYLENIQEWICTVNDCKIVDEFFTLMKTRRITWTEEHINQYHDTMCTTRTMHPIFDMWHTLQSYRHSFHADFITQGSLLIFVTYSNLLKIFAHDDSYLIEKTNHMLNSLDSLSHETILDLIDESYTKMKSIDITHQLTPSPHASFNAYHAIAIAGIIASLAYLAT